MKDTKQKDDLRIAIIEILYDVKNSMKEKSIIERLESALEQMIKDPSSAVKKFAEDKSATDFFLPRMGSGIGCCPGGFKKIHDDKQGAIYAKPLVQKVCMCF